MMMRCLVGFASSGGSTLIRPPISHRSVTIRSASLFRNGNSDSSNGATPEHSLLLTSVSHPSTSLLHMQSPRTIGGANASIRRTANDLSIIRGFAAAAAASSPNQNKKASSPKAKKGDAASDAAALGYLALKKARKEKRRELYEASLQRKARLPTRRIAPNRDANGRMHWSDRKVAFRKWFVTQKVTNEYMNRKARQLGLDWKIKVGVMLVRNSVVLPDKEPWEQDMDELQAYLGQFGKVYPKALIDFDYDAPVAVTDEELMAMLPEGYTPAPRVTEHDVSGNVRTTNRKLKTDVYLVVQNEPNGKWKLPTTILRDDETLLQAAQRAVAESVGPDVEHWTVSNAPLSVQMSSYTDDERNESSNAGLYGTKTFFLKLYYDEGEASTEGREPHDFAWLDREEIVDRVKEQQGDDASTFYRYLL